MVEASRDFGELHRLQPCRGELDGERKTVESPADLGGDGQVGVIEAEVRAHGARPISEELQRGVRHRCHLGHGERAHG